MKGSIAYVWELVLLCRGVDNQIYTEGHLGADILPSKLTRQLNIDYDILLGADAMTAAQYPSYAKRDPSKKT